MRRLFTRINHTLKNAKNIFCIEENTQLESITAPKFSVLINPEDKIILNKRSENLKNIFNILREHEVKLDPYSVGDIYRYHMLRQEVASSYKVPPKLSKAVNVLHDDMEAEGQTQLIGEVNTLDINVSLNE